MAADDKTKKDQPGNAGEGPQDTGVPLKPAGEVVVTHLDSPPPSGPRSIHPRRPAPVVPERRSGADDQPDENQKQRQDSKPE